MKLSKERLQDEMGRLKQNLDSDIAVVEEAAKSVSKGEGQLWRFYLVLFTTAYVDL